jgi:D-alanyl-D-alanine carboxypeptidase
MYKIKFCVCLLALAFNVKGQIPEALKNELNTALDKMVNQVGSKSLSASIQFKDGEVWARANGASSITIPVDENYLYLIGSITKTITSATILQMADEKKLTLDDKIVRWLDPIQYIDTNITIRQLLRHESGIYDILENKALNDKMIQNQYTIFLAKDIVPAYIKPAIFSPGAMWSYSNTNYFLLGMIIEKIADKPFFDEIRDRFYTPLGLTSFAIPAFEPLIGDVAHVWLDTNGDGKTEDQHSFYINYIALNSVAGAAGGYFANAGHVSKWMRTYMRGDLLSKEMMAEAKKTIYASGMPAGGTYGLGLMKLKFQGIEGFGHGGDLGYSAMSWYFPSLDISISVLNNDAKNISWKLVPVINELLKTYTSWQATDVKEFSDKENICVYPNPFSNDLSIDIGKEMEFDKVEFILTNTYGQKVRSTYPINGKQSASFENLGDMPAGMYTLMVTGDNRVVARKKIVKY